jgi:hypothetical protein
MQTQKNLLTPKPVLKSKPKQLILGIIPKPPIENRLPPNLNGDKISRTPRSKREKLSLKESVDYDKLTPSEQARWDVGIYGSIHLKEDRGRQYYVVRWVDPRTGCLRSNSIGKTFEEAKANLRKMVLGERSV